VIATNASGGGDMRHSLWSCTSGAEAEVASIDVFPVREGDVRSDRDFVEVCPSTPAQETELACVMRESVVSLKELHAISPCEDDHKGRAHSSNLMGDSVHRSRNE
jgi:hypothetical protein